MWGSSSCVIVGNLVHNTGIERRWRDVRKSVEPIHVTLIAMEEEGILDPDNEVDIYCLHQALTGRINNRLAGFTQSWNNHPLRSEANSTPLQLFHSHHYDLSDSSDDSDNNGTTQNPSVVDHVEVPNLRFKPCMYVKTLVQALLHAYPRVEDRELYRLITASVGTHIKSMSNACCSMN